MPKHYTNSDTPYTAPSSITLKYQLGRTPFWELGVVSGDLQSSSNSSGAGTVQAASTIGIFFSDIDFSERGSCPELTQYVWVQPDRAIKVVELLEGDHYLYNPITTNLNKVLEARVIKDQQLVMIETKRGSKSLVSVSHKIITNTADKDGTYLSEYKDEILVGEPPNIFRDEIISITKQGKGDVVEISLADEFIYLTGNTKKGGTVAHNLKRYEENF